MSSLPPLLPPIGGDHSKKEIKESQKTPQSDVEKVESATLSFPSTASDSYSLKERKLTIEENDTIQTAINLLINSPSLSKENMDTHINSIIKLLSKSANELFSQELRRSKRSLTQNQLYDLLQRLLFSMFFKVDPESKEKVLAYFIKTLLPKEEKTYQSTFKVIDLDRLKELLRIYQPHDKKNLMDIAFIFIEQSDPEGVDFLLKLDDECKIETTKKLLRIPSAAYSLDLYKLVNSLGKFAKEEQATEFATILAKISPESFCEFIGDSGITKQELLSAIAKRVAILAPDAFVQHQEKFKLDELTKLAIFKKNINNIAFVRFLNNFGFSSNLRYELAKELLTSTVSERRAIALNNFTRFAIEPVSKRIELAELVIKECPREFIPHIEEFEIESMSKRVEFAQQLMTQAPDKMTYHFKKFKIEPESKRLEFVRFLIQQVPQIVYEHIDNFELTSPSTLDIAKLAVSLSLFSHHFEIWGFVSKLAIKDPQFLYGLLHALIGNPTYAEEFLKKMMSPRNNFDLPLQFVRDLFAKALAQHPESANIVSEKRIRELTLLMRNPEELSTVVLEKGSLAAEFREKITKLHPGKSEDARRHDQNILTRWLGYFQFCCQFFEISDKDLRPFEPILNQIFLLRNPALRYQLTYSLIALINSGEKLKLVAESVLSSLKNSGAQLVIPSLTPLIALEPKVDFSKFLRVLDRSTFFTNNVRQMDVIKSIQTIMAIPIWTMQQKQKLFRAIFPMSALGDKEHEAAKLKAFHLAQQAKRDHDLQEQAQKAQELVEQQKKESDALPPLLHNNLVAVQTVIKFGGIIDVTNLINLAPDATFESSKQISSKLYNLLNSLFSQKLGFEVKTKDAIPNLDAVRPKRNPNALFVYAGGLNTLPPEDLKSTQAFLKALIESVLTNTYQAFRYDPNNKHLQEVFSGNETLRQNWQAGESIPFEQLKIQEYLRGKIIRDRHLNPSDYGFITEYLKTQNAAAKQKIKKSLQSRLSELKTGTKEYKQLQLEEGLMKVVSMTDAIARRSLLETLTTQAKELEEIELHQDVKNLSAIAIKMTKETHVGDLVVQDTDEFQDLLLIGTDVDSSCQKITDSSDTNKALLAYIGDGKIRAIVVKNKAGRILARRIIRILIDSKSREPVLMQERLYSVNGIERNIELAVDAMAIRRAQSLGLPLVGAILRRPNYVNDLLSLGSPAPFEYVDTGGGRTFNGPYTIPHTVIEVIWEPVRDKKT